MKLTMTTAYYGAVFQNNKKIMKNYFTTFEQYDERIIKKEIDIPNIPSN